MDAELTSIQRAATAAEASSRSTQQGISIASYNLGCFFGAILAIFIGNPLGRRRMIIIGTAIMVVGAALQASAFSLAHLIVGRIITGLGNGMNTSTVPSWQSETSSSHKRGKMVMFEGSLITAGIMISYWIDLGFSFAPGSVSCELISCKDLGSMLTIDRAVPSGVPDCVLLLHPGYCVEPPGESSLAASQGSVILCGKTV